MHPGSIYQTALHGFVCIMNEINIGVHNNPVGQIIASVSVTQAHFLRVNSQFVSFPSFKPMFQPHSSKLIPQSHTFYTPYALILYFFRAYMFHSLLPSIYPKPTSSKPILSNPTFSEPMLLSGLSLLPSLSPNPTSFRPMPQFHFFQVHALIQYILSLS